MHTVAWSTISRSRLELLFDGVFAIAITLLVLELHVPGLADRHSVAELALGLAQNAATFASYLLSFIMLGSFWYRHNHQYRRFEHITPAMLVLHFVQLAAATFFPAANGTWRARRHDTARLLRDADAGAVASSTHIIERFI